MWLLFGPEPEEEPATFYKSTVQRIASAYQNFHGESHAAFSLRDLDTLLLQGAIDSVPEDGTIQNIPCDGRNIRCIVYVSGGAIAYSLKQSLTPPLAPKSTNPTGPQHYVNFTIIPTSNKPASILLFSDGSIRSGKHYREGVTAPNGLPVITPDPDYAQ